MVSVTGITLAQLLKKSGTLGFINYIFTHYLCFIRVSILRTFMVFIILPVVKAMLEQNHNGTSLFGMCHVLPYLCGILINALLKNSPSCMN